MGDLRLAVRWLHVLAMRRPATHVLEAAVFILTPAIVWLGLSLAHGGWR